MVMKGSTMSAESRAKMSAAAKARGSNRTGTKHSAETRALISARTRERTPRGEQCHSYIDGKSQERKDLRSTPEGRKWRFDVMSRDEFACVHCGDDRGGNLEAHHVQPFAECPERRLDVSNGKTLCVHCHWMAHAYAGLPGL
jgi:5-methylcytosine-specific restriction endonuclease McrA